MKFIADQLAGAGANQNIDRIRPRQRFQARREIYRVADHGRVGFFLRTDVASEDIVMIDANADPERRDPFRFPFRVGGLKFVPHGERGPRTGFGGFRNAPAPHVPPDGHDGVTDKFIKRAIILEDGRRHATQVFVELFDERFRIGAFGWRCQTDDVGKGEAATFPARDP
jgi:hypothetical protein